MESLIEQELLCAIKEMRKIFIYGAGMVGSLVYLRLKAMGVNDARIDFVVTRATENQKYMNHTVYGISDCELGEQCLIIVATMPKNHGQIIDTLKKHNINEYVVVDDELYDDMEREYIKSWLLSNNGSITGDRDILFIASDNNNTSGAFLCMVDLCKGMISRGIKPLVVLPCYGNAEQMLKDSFIDYTYVWSKSGLVDIESDGNQHLPYMNFEAVSKIEKLILQHHIKLVHINSNHTYVGALAAQKTGVPYVWHIRENIREQGLRFNDEERRYELINKATKIITVSDYVGKCYPMLNVDKTVCIYDGVDTSKYYCERDIMSSNTVRILMPGIMVPLKGQHQLVEAAKKLKDEGICFDISFVGSGDADYIKVLEEKVNEYKLNNSIHFFGRVNNLEEWYKNTDIVVVCSRSEAFGRVTVEAQLAGCIVIGANCGATPELITDGVTGFLYELDNIEMLKCKIIEAYSDKKSTSEIAKKGQRKAMKLYDKSMNCDEIIKEYKKILGDKI